MDLKLREEKGTLDFLFEYSGEVFKILENVCRFWQIFGHLENPEISGSNQGATRVPFSATLFRFLEL